MRLSSLVSSSVSFPEPREAYGRTTRQQPDRTSISQCCPIVGHPPRPARGGRRPSVHRDCYLRHSHPWHSRCCDSPELFDKERDMGDATNIPTRRDLLRLGAAGAIGMLSVLHRAPARAADKLVVGVIYVGPRDDYGYNQAQAQARGGDQEDARRDRRRAGEGAGDDRRAEDDGLDDRAGRRHAALPDLVRLLRPAHAARWPRSTPRSASPTAAACGPRASTPRTWAATSATSTSAST